LSFTEATVIIKYDVISQEGKLLKKITLGPFFSNGSILTKVLQGPLYLVREKESEEKKLLSSGFIKIY